MAAHEPPFFVAAGVLCPQGHPNPLLGQMRRRWRSDLQRIWHDDLIHQELRRIYEQLVGVGLEAYFLPS